MTEDRLSRALALEPQGEPDRLFALAVVRRIEKLRWRRMMVRAFASIIAAGGLLAVVLAWTPLDSMTLEAIVMVVGGLVLTRLLSRMASLGSA